MNLSLELRDLKTSQTMLVPPAGLVFGREGGDADVTFRDAGISKRHARVFQQGPNWMLQDLGSSNGTWMKGQRIGDAVKLAPGDIFILNKQQLQVMSVVAPTSLGAPTEGEMPAQDEEEQQNEPTPRPAPAPKPPPGRGAPEPRSAANKMPSQGPAKRPAPAMLRAAPEDLPEEPEPEAQGDGGGDDAMPDDTGAANAEDAAAALKSKGIGYFFIAVPKALAFYLAAVPVMLFNPVGTIRNGPKKMKFEAMGPIELIPYALVPGLIGAAMGFLGGLVAQLIGMIFYHGGLSVGALLGSLIVGPIIAVVSAVITGFLLHPVLGWIVKFLKGESDAKSRTNYFIQMETAVVLTQVPAFLAPLMLMIHLPLVGIVPVIVSAAASVITTMVAYFWFVQFGVAKWFQYVLLACAGLACLGALASLPAAIRGPGTGVAGSGMTGDMEADMAKLRAQAEQAQKDAQAAQNAGDDAVKKAGKDVKAAADKLPDGVQEVPVADAKEATKPPPAKDKEQPKAKEPDKVAAKDNGKDVPPPPHDSGGGGNYGQWNSHREQIEKQITDDPLILNRAGGLLEMYRKYEQYVYDADQKWGKATAKKPSERRVNEHLRDAELFNQTGPLVNEMWERMGH